MIKINAVQGAIAYEISVQILQTGAVLHHLSRVQILKLCHVIRNVQRARAAPNRVDCNYGSENETFGQNKKLFQANLFCLICAPLSLQ